MGSGVGSSIIVNGLGSSTLVRLVTGFLSVVTYIYLNLNTCFVHGNLNWGGNIIGLGSSTLVRLVTGFLSIVTDIYLNLNACLVHGNLHWGGNIIGSNMLSSFGGVIMYLRDRSVHYCNLLVLYSCTVYRLYSVYSTNAFPGQAVRVVLKKQTNKKKKK